MIPLSAEPARHPWFPVSTCGDSCLGPRGTKRVALLVDALVVGQRLCRLAAVVCWIVGMLVADEAVARLRHRPRRALRARASGPLLAALGIRVVVDDRRRDPRATGLIVANHISFLDVLALALVSSAHVVAKSDVVDMPVVAGIARRFGVIAVDRGTLRGLPAAVGGVCARLAADSSVIVFPEGTTFCGRTGGEFRPAFFQAAIDAAVPVLPVRLRFLGPDGHAATDPSFIGDDSPLDTLRRVLRARGLTVVVRLEPAEAPGTDRRELARRCERVLSSAESDIDCSLI
ncbi:1-acyl-sn-glycerol-3-phosphate acyltransferase [Gordonia sp. GONU]|uniref:lysophospholipid acyltransferase family protein n=1 Tax=Gordonia TaxID=2053 RepID=UPI0021AC5935|nr:MULTISPECIES: lysophospholipid acyltransferase family protein [Gordonia]MCR8898860.1 1-acyl-sn-glycerol-3-phosphate acyltransferase [Gordonia sp. GONU]MCZ0913929.1 lysophospholipid acyltransferase family protein [Gordonia amicalis]MCZ4650507.1 lysophospholipid acyltransferase family protein [Gordonia amicalis]